MGLLISFKLLIVLFFVIVEIVLDLGDLPRVSQVGRRRVVETYLSQNGIPMGF